MHNKREMMLSSVRFLALTHSMQETTDYRYVSNADISFEKDNKIYGFITEFDCDTEQLKNKINKARAFFDYIYVLTDSTAKRRELVKIIPKKCGIVCYSNAFGLGYVYQELQNAAKL